MSNRKCEKHEIRRSRCRECGGSEICPHTTEINRLKFNCILCNPDGFCPCGKKKSQCITCAGNQICAKHNQRKSTCTGCLKGTEMCPHGIRKRRCKNPECFDTTENSEICKHKIYRYTCRDKACNGKGICKHNIPKRLCAECDGGGLCEAHKKDKRRCFECGTGSDVCKGHLANQCFTYGNKKYNNYCTRCFRTLFPDEPICNNFRVKEHYWVDFIKEKFTGYTWSFDRIIPNAVSKYRPDAMIDLGDYVIICEHDEFQHNRKTKYCYEDKRLSAIRKDLDQRPLIIIRFNPDSYTDESGKKHGGCWDYDEKRNMRINPAKKDEMTDRLNAFQEKLLYHINNPPTDDITEVNLFYSDFVRDDEEEDDEYWSDDETKEEQDNAIVV